jgi:hypothetical protein
MFVILDGRFEVETDDGAMTADRGFLGEEAARATLMAALRHARCSPHEPVGILSHHLVMDEAAWDFLRSLLERARAMSGVEVRAASRIFASREARP